MVRNGVIVRVKDEPNIIEWMLYHFNMGFNYILINDDTSKPSVQEIIDDYNNKIFKLGNSKILKELMEHYGSINENNYQIINIFPNRPDNVLPELNHPIKFWSKVLPIVKEKMDYTLLLDIDEYLVLKDDFKTINDVINYYGNFDQLRINWLLFGNNYLKKADNTTLIKNYTRSDEYLFHQSKCLTKVSSIKSCHDPHFFDLYPSKQIDIDIFGNPFKQFKENQVNNDKNVKLYISHYRNTDTETFMRRRYLRLTNNIFFNFDKNINNVKNYFLQYKDDIINFINDTKNHKLKDTSRLRDIFKVKKDFDKFNRNNVINNDLQFFYPLIQV